MTRDDMELAGLVGRAINARHNPDALTHAVNAIVDWHENRWVRWLDVLEQHRAERRLAVFADAEELERALEARLAAGGHVNGNGNTSADNPAPPARPHQEATRAVA